MSGMDFCPVCGSAFDWNGHCASCEAARETREEETTAPLEGCWSCNGMGSDSILGCPECGTRTAARTDRTSPVARFVGLGTILAVLLALFDLLKTAL